MTDPGRVRLSTQSNLRFELVTDLYSNFRFYENFDFAAPGQRTKERSGRYDFASGGHFDKTRPHPEIGMLSSHWDFSQLILNLSGLTILAVMLRLILCAESEPPVVAGYVQVPCIERCAYGAIKAWTACCIASE